MYDNLKIGIPVEIEENAADEIDLPTYVGIIVNIKPEAKYSYVVRIEGHTTGESSLSSDKNCEEFDDDELEPISWGKYYGM